MDADYDIFEIVSVIRDFWLLDAEFYQRRYFTQDGQTLEPGYYVVNWPDHIQTRRFNEHALFSGPFRSRQEAREICERKLQEWKCFLAESDRSDSLASDLRRNLKKAA